MKKFKYLLLLIPLLFITNVQALTLDTQDITWYYRRTSDETILLNTIKNVDTPLHIVNGEYMNGFTTRQDYTFTKDLQYMITYKLKMLYYEGIDSSFRNDTIDRLISYSWVDSDFKLLNTNINQTKYLCESDICLREITISQQVLTLNNTSGIRFGVYTTEAKSIGFYSPGADGVNITLSDTINIEDNSSSTIIDQNNQIIDGQNSIQNSITNTQNSINQNINDMEQAIVDSNKETQDVIKDQFNSCRDSYNLFNKNNFSYELNYYNNNGSLIASNSTGRTTMKIPVESNNIYTISGYSLMTYQNQGTVSRIYYYDQNKQYISRSNLISGTTTYTFTTPENCKYIDFQITVKTDSDTVNKKFQDDLNTFQLEKGSNANKYEPYGEEICSNKIDETNNQLGDLNNSLNNSNTSSATNDASNFFSNFTTDTFGLTSIITAPLSLINSITSTSCSTLRLPLPYLENEYLELPCMDTIYTEYFGSFFNIYQTITFGIVAYWVIVRIFNQVKDFKNPDHDEIEVLDL